MMKSNESGVKRRMCDFIPDELYFLTDIRKMVVC